MATWNNNSKNTSTFTNRAFGLSGLTWNDATFTWDQANGTWDNPRDVYVNQTKNTSSFTNRTKN